MKPSFYSLSPEQQATYGNGCGLNARFLRVPQFIFAASCRHHDFNYERGCGADRWYQNLWRGPYYKLKADLDFSTHMFEDALISSRPVLYALVSIVYFLGVALNPVAWVVFTYGRWRTIEEILAADHNAKMRP